MSEHPSPGERTHDAYSGRPYDTTAQSRGLDHLNPTLRSLVVRRDPSGSGWIVANMRLFPRSGLGTSSRHRVEDGRKEKAWDSLTRRQRLYHGIVAKFFRARTARLIPWTSRSMLVLR